MQKRQHPIAVLGALGIGLSVVSTVFPTEVRAQSRILYDCQVVLHGHQYDYPFFIACYDPLNNETRRAVFVSGSLRIQGRSRTLLAGIRRAGNLAGAWGIGFLFRTTEADIQRAISPLN